MSPLPVLPLLQEPAATGEEVQLLFERLPEAWVLGLVVVPLVLALAFLSYRRPRRPRPLRRLLAGLRILLLAVALFLAFGPYLRHRTTREEPAPLALLLDDSASMATEDPLSGEARQALAEWMPEPGPRPARLELLRGLLQGPWRATLEERYELRAWRFAGRLAPTAADGSALEGRGGATALGSALLGILAEHRGRRMPDVVLLSDGRSNLGPAVQEAAARLAAENIRVHAVALGDPRPAPDLRLERVQVPDVVLAGDEALFTLRVRGTGDPLPEEVEVRLEDRGGRVLARGRIPLAGEAGSLVSLGARLDLPGEELLTARVDPLPEETRQGDNAVEIPVTVRNVRIRVLYLDGKPRWEYRYVKERLIRAEDDVVAHCWLADADRLFSQEVTPTYRPLREVPETVEQLAENFDVVILGDVDPADLGPDPLTGARFAEALEEFVHRGGGLLCLAGPRAMPEAWRGTPVESLLPVVLGREPDPGLQSFRPVLPDLGNPHPAVLLENDLERNARVWASLPPLTWFQPVERLRPGARAWLLHPELGNRHGPYAIAASTYVPEGWVAWLGTDETWRWRDPWGERYLQKLWRGMLRFLAATRLRSGQGRARLDLDRTRVEVGESLTVEARLRDEAFLPLDLPEGVEVFLEGRGTPVHLAPVAGEAGRYRGRLRVAAPGPGALVLTADGQPDGEELARARFEAILPSREMADPSQDTAALEALTRRTGGLLVQARDAGRLLERLDGRERLSRTLKTEDEPLDGRPLLTLFLLAAALEWWLRKRANLS